MNPIKAITRSKNMTYQEIADCIAAVTGREYSPDYLGNVARGTVTLSDGLKFNLLRAFPDIFLDTTSQNGELIAPNGQ